MSKPVLAVIIASVRPGRMGDKVGAWVAEQAASHGAFEVDLIDLQQVQLPLTLTEANHPAVQNYQLESTRAWSERISRASAVVLVTPEYNHGYPASLKNALDLLYKEWWYKPVGFASYGGVSGGLRSVSQLKQVISFLRMVPASDGLIVPMIAASVRDGRFEPTDFQVTGTHQMLEELKALTVALEPLQNR